MVRDNDWKVAVAGECMVARPFSMHDEPDFLAIARILRESDVTYAHLEMNLGDFSEIGWPARGDWFGSYMLADAQLARDLKWLGIDTVSLANNHSLDFGASGLLSTRANTEQAGLAGAGTGRDLEEAREPAYLETPRGRVALISVSSGNKAHECGVARARVVRTSAPSRNSLVRAAGGIWMGWQTDGCSRRSARRVRVAAAGLLQPNIRLAVILVHALALA